MMTHTQTSTNEQIVLRIMRSLPDERVTEFLDFARFLEFQATKSARQQDATEYDEEHAWGDVLAKPGAKDVLRSMAREALEEYETGQATEITTTEDGRLAPA